MNRHVIYAPERCQLSLLPPLAGTRGEPLAAHHVQVLLSAGDATATKAAPTTALSVRSLVAIDTSILPRSAVDGYATRHPSAIPSDARLERSLLDRGNPIRRPPRSCRRVYGRGSKAQQL